MKAPNVPEFVDHALHVAVEVENWDDLPGWGRSYGQTMEHRRTVALLHDAIEDGSAHVSLLTRLGDGVLQDVVMLTRTSTEKYSEYIARIIREGSNDALAVKLADVTVNFTRSVPQFPELRTRYEKAKHDLLEEWYRRVEQARLEKGVG